MEDTHGAVKYATTGNDFVGLNPYYNGRYSWSPMASNHDVVLEWS